jgi:hypothetical protein
MSNVTARPKLTFLGLLKKLTGKDFTICPCYADYLSRLRQKRRDAITKIEVQANKNIMDKRQFPPPQLRDI